MGTFAPWWRCLGRISAPRARIELQFGRRTPCDVPGTRARRARLVRVARGRWRWPRCREWAGSANLAPKVRETHSGSLKTHPALVRARRPTVYRSGAFARLKMSHGALPDVDPEIRFGHFSRKVPPSAALGRRRPARPQIRLQRTG